MPKWFTYVKIQFGKVNIFKPHKFDKFRSLINGKKSIHNQQEYVGNVGNNDDKFIEGKNRCTKFGVEKRLDCISIMKYQVAFTKLFYYICSSPFKRIANHFTRSDS
jgi:hypothetical protein